MLRFKNEQGVVSSCLHIFATKYVCCENNMSGALGGNAILRRPRPVYKYLICFIDIKQKQHFIYINMNHFFRFPGLR